MFTVGFLGVRGSAGGTVTTRELRANDRFQIGDITVTIARLDHAGHSIVHATDTEIAAREGVVLSARAADEAAAA